MTAIKEQLPIIISKAPHVESRVVADTALLSTLTEEVAMMMCYAGIDLHATNSVLVVIDDADRVLYQKRLRNDLPLILTTLEPYRLALNGIVVESTYNWYWLVDGLMEAGYRVHLAHAPALPQYSGLKHADDQHDENQIGSPIRRLRSSGHTSPLVLSVLLTSDDIPS